MVQMWAFPVGASERTAAQAYRSAGIDVRSAVPQGLFVCACAAAQRTACACVCVRSSVHAHASRTEWPDRRSGSTSRAHGGRCQPCGAHPAEKPANPRSQIRPTRSVVRAMNRSPLAAACRSVLSAFPRARHASPAEVCACVRVCVCVWQPRCVPAARRPAAESTGARDRRAAAQTAVMGCTMSSRCRGRGCGTCRLTHSPSAVSEYVCSPARTRMHACVRRVRACAARARVCACVHACGCVRVCACV